MSWEKVFYHGSVTLRNSKGTVNATDREAIALSPKAASGMLFRVVLAPKSLKNFVILVNDIPGTVDKLHERCREQGLGTSYVHHPRFKPSLKEKNNSIVIPYARIEKLTDKLCLGCLPVIEILSFGKDEVLLPE